MTRRRKSRSEINEARKRKYRLTHPPPDIPSPDDIINCPLCQILAMRYSKKNQVWECWQCGNTVDESPMTAHKIMKPEA